MEYETPDSVPMGVRCRVIHVPDSDAFEACVRGALQTLLNPNNWKKFGTLTQQECADAFIEMFDDFCFHVGDCA